MAEYIDKNELISKCHPVIDVGMSMKNIGVTLDEIMEIPAVDAVEVVRCKDCKYYKTTACISFSSSLISISRQQNGLQLKSGTGEQTMIELKPCPFCGEEILMVHSITRCDYVNEIRVFCRGCRAFITVESCMCGNAKEIWNRRADEVEFDKGFDEVDLYD